MRRALLYIVFACFLAGSGYSQSNIPNGSLENWYNVVVSGSLNYDQPGVGPADNWLATLNELASIPPPIGPGPVTAFKTDDKYGGTWACKLVSENFVLVPSDVFIPGFLGTAKINMITSNATIGRTCNGCRPLSFKGWYKYSPANGDSATAVILVSKWNSATHKRDTIGYGKMIEKNEVEAYREFNIPVTYFSSAAPDTLAVMVIASAGFNVVNFMGSTGQVGSTMYVDELMLEYPTGIQQALMPDETVNCYPVPAKESVTFELGGPVPGGYVEICDLRGRLLTTFRVSGLKTVIPVGTFSEGTYYFRLKQENHILNTGSFTVKR